MEFMRRVGEGLTRKPSLQAFFDVWCGVGKPLDLHQSSEKIKWQKREDVEEEEEEEGEEGEGEEEGEEGEEDEYRIPENSFKEWYVPARSDNMKMTALVLLPDDVDASVIQNWHDNYVPLLQNALRRRGLSVNDLTDFVVWRVHVTSYSSASVMSKVAHETLIVAVLIVTNSVEDEQFFQRWLFHFKMNHGLAADVLIATVSVQPVITESVFDVKIIQLPRAPREFVGKTGYIISLKEFVCALRGHLLALNNKDFSLGVANAFTPTVSIINFFYKKANVHSYLEQNFAFQFFIRQQQREGIQYGGGLRKCVLVATDNDQKIAANSTRESSLVTKMFVERVEFKFESGFMSLASLIQSALETSLSNVTLDGTFDKYFEWVKDKTYADVTFSWETITDSLLADYKMPVGRLSVHATPKINKQQVVSIDGQGTPGSETVKFEWGRTTKWAVARITNSLVKMYPTTKYTIAVHVSHLPATSLGPKIRDLVLQSIRSWVIVKLGEPCLVLYEGRADYSSVQFDYKEDETPSQQPAAATLTLTRLSKRFSEIYDKIRPFCVRFDNPTIDVDKLMAGTMQAESEKKGGTWSRSDCKKMHDLNGLILEMFRRLYHEKLLKCLVKWGTIDKYLDVKLKRTIHFCPLHAKRLASFQLDIHNLKFEWQWLDKEVKRLQMILSMDPKPASWTLHMVILMHRTSRWIPPGWTQGEDIFHESLSVQEVDHWELFSKKVKKTLRFTLTPKENGKVRKVKYKQYLSRRSAFDVAVTTWNSGTHVRHTLAAVELVRYASYWHTYFRNHFYYEPHVVASEFFMMWSDAVYQKAVFPTPIPTLKKIILLWPQADDFVPGPLDPTNQVTGPCVDCVILRGLEKMDVAGVYVRPIIQRLHQRLGFQDYTTIPFRFQYVQGNEILGTSSASHTGERYLIVFLSEADANDMKDLLGFQYMQRYKERNIIFVQCRPVPCAADDKSTFPFSVTPQPYPIPFLFAKIPKEVSDEKFSDVSKKELNGLVDSIVDHMIHWDLMSVVNQLAGDRLDITPVKPFVIHRPTHLGTQQVVKELECLVKQLGMVLYASNIQCTEIQSTADKSGSFELTQPTTSANLMDLVCVFDTHMQRLCQKQIQILNIHSKRPWGGMVFKNDYDRRIWAPMIVGLSFFLFKSLTVAECKLYKQTEITPFVVPRYGMEFDVQLNEEKCSSRLTCLDGTLAFQDVYHATLPEMQNPAHAQAISTQLMEMWTITDCKRETEDGKKKKLSHSAWFAEKMFFSFAGFKKDEAEIPLYVIRVDTFSDLGTLKAFLNFAHWLGTLCRMKMQQAGLKTPYQARDKKLHLVKESEWLSIKNKTALGISLPEYFQIDAKESFEVGLHYLTENKEVQTTAKVKVQFHTYGEEQNVVLDHDVFNRIHFITFVSKFVAKFIPLPSRRG